MCVCVYISLSFFLCCFGPSFNFSKLINPFLLFLKNCLYHVCATVSIFRTSWQCELQKFWSEIGTISFLSLYFLSLFFLVMACICVCGSCENLVERPILNLCWEVSVSLFAEFEGLKNTRETGMTQLFLHFV